MPSNLPPHYLGRPFRYLITTAKRLAAAHLILTHVFAIEPTEGVSMLPTFNKHGDSILISKLHGYRARHLRSLLGIESNGFDGSNSVAAAAAAAAKKATVAPLDGGNHNGEAHHTQNNVRASKWTKWSKPNLSITTGDLIVFKIPIFESDSGVKRVMGMPGDYIVIGTPASSAPPTTDFGAARQYRQLDGGSQMLQIPPGHCWVVGDNLEASRDSRVFGPVPLALVEGKVVAKFNWYTWQLTWFGHALGRVDEGEERGND